MMRLNLFTELAYMETILDERTERTILRRHYRFSSTVPLLLFLCVLGLSSAFEHLRPRLPLFLCLLILCLMVGWPVYQFSAGIFRLEIDTNPLHGGLGPRSRAYFSVSLALYLLAGGLVPLLGACILTPVRDPVTLSGIYVLGCCACYLIFCAAHQRFLHGQQPELPACGPQNAAALTLLALAALLGAGLTAAGFWNIFPISAA